MRASSIIIGLCHLIVGIGASITGSRFKAIYIELFDGDTALPVLSQLVIAMSPHGWLAFGLIAAVLLIAKDCSETLRRIPNWPFAISLLFIGVITVVALFLPLLIVIEAMGT